MRIAALSGALRAKAQRLKTEIIAAESITRTEAVAAAKQASSGTLTTADLRAMGHPYAVRNPTAADPGTINAQTGDLRAAWTGDGPKAAAFVVTTRVFNADPKSVYMLGTRVMIARPIQDKIVAAVTPARTVRLKRAIQVALTS